MSGPHDAYRRLKRALAPLRPVYDAWMSLISLFNWVLARVLLTVMFFTIFLAYGVVLRIVRRDPMKRQLDEERDTYWGENVPFNDDIEDFKKLY